MKEFFKDKILIEIKYKHGVIIYLVGYKNKKNLFAGKVNRKTAYKISKHYGCEIIKADKITIDCSSEEQEHIKDDIIIRYIKD